MAMRYADRAFLSMNGGRLSDVQRATLRQRANSKVVKTATDDGFNRGFVQGNKDIEIDATIAVVKSLARPKFDFIDYEANDVQMTWACGADLFVATGLCPPDSDDDFSDVGTEVKTNFKWNALRLRDTVGNSSLLNLVLK